MLRPICRVDEYRGRYLIFFWNINKDSGIRLMQPHRLKVLYTENYLRPLFFLGEKQCKDLTDFSRPPIVLRWNIGCRKQEKFFVTFVLSHTIALSLDGYKGSAECGLQMQQGSTLAGITTHCYKNIVRKVFFGLCEHHCLMMIHLNRTICRAFVLS